MAVTLSLPPPSEAGAWTPRLQRGARLANWTMAAIGMVGLLGWLLDLPLLTTFGIDSSRLLPSGCAMLLAGAMALAGLHGASRPYGRHLAWSAASFISLVAGLSLLRRMGVDVDPGLLRLGDPPGMLRTASAACSYLLLAAALACAPAESGRLHDLTRALAVAVAGVALVALVGTGLRVFRLAIALPSVGLALPVAFGMLAGSFSLLALRPSPRMLQLLARDTPGAVIVRRLVPAAIALPLLVGWVQVVGYRGGWFDIAAGEGVTTVFAIVACTVLILWTSARLDEMNATRSDAEQRAELQREWLEVTLANIGDAVITAGADGRVSLINAAAERLLAIPARTAVGQPVAELVHLAEDDSNAPLPCPLTSSLTQRGPVVAESEAVLCLADGQRHAVEANAMPIVDAEGGLVGGVLVLREVAARRAHERAMRVAYEALDRRVEERTAALERTAAALRESSALLETFAASTPELIIAKDRAGRITLINPAALTTLGLTREQAIGRSKSELYGESEETRHIFQCDQLVMETGQPMSVEEHLETPRGKRTFLVTKSPMRDEHGHIVGLVGVATDITDRKQAQRELEDLLVDEHRLRGEAERANRAKDEFLAIVSHELRSPLNALKGWSHVLSGTPNPDPVLVARAVQAIKRNVDHQARLIDDLLDTSRIISGKLTLERRPVNLVEVVHAAMDLSRASALAKRIELRFTSDYPVVTADGDPGRLQQVVINLLSNAIKFTPDEGRVEIDLRRIGERIELTVSDNGIGIESDFLPHVFDRFSQADTSSTRRYWGLGIGLALVRHLVELHGGTVRAVSAGAGHGSTFTIELPATHTAIAGLRAAASEGRFDPGAALRDIRVLVVDDDPDARDVMTFALEHAGGSVRAFASGRELLQALAEGPAPAAPVVLVLDIAMPGEDGFSVLEQVRAMTRLPFIPAIAVTALTYLDRRQLTYAGFQDCLGKPLDAGRLIESIINVVCQEQAPAEDAAQGVRKLAS